MKPVGYLTKYPNGLDGERGIYYDYVLASNGLFIEAEGKLVAARVPVAACEVRGLAPLEPKVVLRYGLIPRHFFDLALSTMFTTPDKERYVAVTWKDGYHISVPDQAADVEHLGESIDAGHGSGAGVAYLQPDSVMLDMHTHPKMRAGFSFTDNRDETGLKLYAVVGHVGPYREVTPDLDNERRADYVLSNCPAIRLRVGVYGYFHQIAWKDVFEGDLGPEMVDMVDEPEIIMIKEEVIGEDELHSGIIGQPGSPEDSGGWLRRHWRLRRGGSVPAISE